MIGMTKSEVLSVERFSKNPCMVAHFWLTVVESTLLSSISGSIQ